MNWTCQGILVAVFAACVLPGCATAPKSTEAAQVRVYAPEDLAKVPYELVKRLRVQSGSAAIRTPGYNTAVKGIAVLQAEAARLGANGLSEVTCQKYDLGRPAPVGTTEPAFICTGNAIRVRDSGS
jgi:hypothetical protein